MHLPKKQNNKSLIQKIEIIKRNHKCVNTSVKHHTYKYQSLTENLGGHFRENFKKTEK